MTPAVLKHSGDKVPQNAVYETICCHAQRTFVLGDVFPSCPSCTLAASWRSIV